MKKILFIFLFLFIPFNVFAEDNLIVNSKSGILIEANSGKIIYEKNKDLKVSIASMTKMVAQIIILEEIDDGNINWDDLVTVSSNASSMGGSQIYLEEGEQMSVEDLMKGISVASGNDATVAMAEYISGTEEKFVTRMNKKVKELGLKNTVFKNCTGLDEEGHYSTAYDMAMIARELVVNHSEILKFSSIYEDYLRKDSDNKFWLVNTNKLINSYTGADGLKTGHTDAAGYCLAATAKRDDLRLIAIVLGEEDSKVRNSETTLLLDYGFNTVKLKRLKNKNTVVSKIELDKADKKYVDVVLSDNLNVLEDVGDNNNYTYKVNLNDFKLPLKVGDVIGSYDVYLKKKKINSVNLTVSSDVLKLNLFNLYKNNLIDLVFGNF
jgi:D-alanyl-D-alanine carboxypeptidase (penicillin-binding protein 5/6)